MNTPTRRVARSIADGCVRTGCGDHGRGHHAARAFYELAEAAQASIETVNYAILGPRPAPTAQQLVDAVKQAVPGAKLDFKVNPQISRLVDAVGGLNFDDRYARSEWGWKHAFDLPEIIDSFVKAGKGV